MVLLGLFSAALGFDFATLRRAALAAHGLAVLAACVSADFAGRRTRRLAGARTLADLPGAGLGIEVFQVALPSLFAGVVALLPAFLLMASGGLCGSRPLRIVSA